jgi:integrase
MKPRCATPGVARLRQSPPCPCRIVERTYNPYEVRDVERTYNPESKITVLVDQHLVRLAEDGRAARTLDTYRFASGKMATFVGGVRVGEATPARIDAAIRSMRTAHGATMARQSRTILRGALQLAVMANVLGSNPVRDVQPITSTDRPKGATALTAEQLREMLAKLRADDYCRRNDLVDPITMLIATGLRRSELLGLRWTDFDEDTGTITVSGKVVRVSGKGLVRVDDTKSEAGHRTLSLPNFAITTLQARRNLPLLGEQPVIFRPPRGRCAIRTTSVASGVGSGMSWACPV